jgi:Helix-turn-helix domain
MKALQRGSQNERILAHLVGGSPITTLVAFQRYRVCRLSERIRELKRRGHKIRTIMVCMKGTDRRMAEYRISR